MIDFPASTAVHRKLPKETFYKHLPLTVALSEGVALAAGGATLDEVWNNFTTI